jgi:hypothetical protein
MQYPGLPNRKLTLACARRKDSRVRCAAILPHGASPKPRQYLGLN